MVALHVLEMQLRRFRVFEAGDRLEVPNKIHIERARERALTHALLSVWCCGRSTPVQGEAEFQDTFKDMWANNADILSLQYSGTEALKNDFTRTGKRSFLGLLNDGYNSVQRIYKSHFKDEERQDAIDMVQGHYVLDPAACERGMEEEVSHFVCI